MRAARLHEIGATPQVDEIPGPEGADVVSVAMSALNPVDITIGGGRYYGGTPPLPYVTGSEAVGTTADGRRVWLRGGGYGLMAETVSPTDWMFEIPEGLDNASALACGTAGLTAWLALTWRTQVRPDDTVLVLGASGTLGSTAVQAAKLLGARRVIGAARRVDRISSAADEVFDLANDDDLPEASLIIDGLWGEPVERAIASARPGARIVQYGQSAGPAATLLSGWVRGKMANILGQALAAVPVDAAERGYRELCEHARHGRIVYETESYPLDGIAEAWARQSSGSPGTKLVISLS
jgi:NADPH:quinone reductase-like Zn-dependent oxidoreductase